jgi:hypothetical protein
MVVLSNFVVRPIKGAAIGSGFRIGYEGQPCFAGRHQGGSFLPV